MKAPGDVGGTRSVRQICNACDNYGTWEGHALLQPVRKAFEFQASPPLPQTSADLFAKSIEYPLDMNRLTTRIPKGFLIVDPHVHYWNPTHFKCVHRCEKKHNIRDNFGLWGSGRTPHFHTTNN
eukprot:1366315-Amorphochlora_amoeboformis.AAC.1